MLEAECTSDQTLFDPDAEAQLDQLDAVAGEIERWEREGMRLLTVLDHDYPDNLRTVHDRPPLVFVAGELLPEDARSIAVVGAREATPAGAVDGERNRRARGRERLHGRIGAGPRDRHGRPHGGPRAREPDRRRDRHGPTPLLSTRERRAPAPARTGRRCDLAVLAGRSAEPPQLPDAQRGDVGAVARERRRRGLANERLANAGARSRSSTGDPCSCRTRCSIRTGHGNSPRVPARTCFAARAKSQQRSSGSPRSGALVP